MMGYSWPGNIRELKNIIEKIMNFQEEDTIDLKHLPEELRPPGKNQPTLHSSFKEMKAEAVAHLSKDYIKSLLSLFKGNISRAASRARMDRGNFRRLMKRYDISAKEFK